MNQLVPFIDGVFGDGLDLAPTGVVDLTLVVLTAAFWAAASAGWRLTVGGLRELSAYRPPRRPVALTGQEMLDARRTPAWSGDRSATVADMDDRPRLAGLRIAAGTAILAPATLALIRCIDQIGVRGEVHGTVIAMVAAVAAVTIVTGLLGVIARLPRSRGRVGLGVGNMFIAGVVLGVMGWLALRTTESRAALSAFLVTAQAEVARTRFSSVEAIVFGCGVLITLVGHVLLTVAHRRAHRVTHADLEPELQTTAPTDRSGIDAEGRLSGARDDYRRQGKGELDVRSWWRRTARSRRGVRFVHHGPAADGAAVLGVGLVMFGSPVLFAAASGAMVATWQLVVLGVLALISFARALRACM